MIISTRTELWKSLAAYRCMRTHNIPVGELHCRLPADTARRPVHSRKLIKERVKEKKNPEPTPRV